MSLVDIRHLYFSYEGSPEPVFDDVSFSFDTSYRLGLIGRNGEGKTTFLRLLDGTLDDGGAIDIKVPVAYFPFSITHEDINLEDLVYLLKPEIEYWRFEKEFNLLGLDRCLLSRPYKELSGGEKTKFQLAILFSDDDYYLLIDEPTDHLDLKGREKLAEYLHSKDNFLLVSHDRYFLDLVVDHILEFSNGNIELYNGNFSSWYQNYLDFKRYNINKNIRLKKEITRLNKSIEQATYFANKKEGEKIGNGPCDRGFIGARAKRLMKRAENIKKRKEQMVINKQRAIENIDEDEELRLYPLVHPKNTLISLDYFSIVYDRKLFEPISVNINYKDIVLIEGNNGSGKTSLIKCLLKENDHYQGELYLANNLIISYLPQELDYLKGSITEICERENIDIHRVYSTLAKLGFEEKLYQSDVATYSMGQKKKLTLVLCICKNAHLYILDEPMNYLDIFARMMIEDLIAKSEMTMLIVEHDKSFIDKCINKRIVLER